MTEVRGCSPAPPAVGGRARQPHTRWLPSKLPQPTGTATAAPGGPGACGHVRTHDLESAVLNGRFQPVGLRSNPVPCTSFQVQATPVLMMVWDHGQEEGTMDLSLWLLSQVVMGWGGWVQHPVADHGGPAPTPRPDHSLTSHLSPDKGDSKLPGTAWTSLQSPGTFAPPPVA